MDVSVVVPTLNEANFVEDCLDSVRRNLDEIADGVDVEVIIVDSQSSDDTVSRVRSHPVDCRIAYADEGILNAREVGVEAADGDIVVSLDADTVYDEDCLASLLSPFRARDDVVLTYGPCYGEHPLHVDASVRLALQFGLPLVGLYWVSGANRAFEKSAFRAVGGYDGSKDARSVFHVMVEEQARFPIEMHEEGEIVFVDEATAVQSSRTLEQLFLVGEKTGGRKWSILEHYRLLARFKELGRNVTDR